LCLALVLDVVVAARLVCRARLAGMRAKTAEANKKARQGGLS